MSKNEVWRPIDGWPYEVSDLGRVRRAAWMSPRSIRATRPGRVLRPRVRSDGYIMANLRDAPRCRHFCVHRLVALAFLGPAPAAGLQVAHGDGDRANNRATNLRWATPSDNAADMIRHGRTTRGEKQPAHKISAEDALAIRAAYAAGAHSQQALADVYGIGQAQVSRIVRRVKWAWLQERTS